MPNTYTLIASTNVGATSVSTVTFSSIPATYTDLIVKTSTRTDYAPGFLDLNLFLNGNASSGYSFKRLYADGGANAATNGSASSGTIPSTALGSSQTANTFSNNEFYIPNYTSTNYKSVSVDGVTENNSQTSYATFTAGLSTLSTAITSISFGLGAGSFVQYSTFDLYGIKNS